MDAGLAAVVADIDPAVAAEDQPVRVLGIDPHAAPVAERLVHDAVRRPAQAFPGLAAVVRAGERLAGDVDRLGVVRIDLELVEGIRRLVRARPRSRRSPCASSGRRRPSGRLRCPWSAEPARRRAAWPRRSPAASAAAGFRSRPPRIACRGSSGRRRSRSGRSGRSGARRRASSSSSRRPPFCRSRSRARPAHNARAGGPCRTWPRRGCPGRT